MGARWNGKDDCGTVTRADLKVLPKSSIRAKQPKVRRTGLHNTPDAWPPFVLRAYHQHAPGTTLVVVARTLGSKGWQVSTEYRGGATGHGKVQSYPPTDTAGVLGVAAHVATTLALDPARCGILCVVTDDALDPGVAHRASLLLLAAVTQAVRHADPLAA